MQNVRYLASSLVSPLVSPSLSLEHTLPQPEKTRFPLTNTSIKIEDSYTYTTPLFAGLPHITCSVCQILCIGVVGSFFYFCFRLTPQLKELELVHKRFRDEGLVVLGVPSNDFGEQEVRRARGLTCHSFVGRARGGGVGGLPSSMYVLLVFVCRFGEQRTDEAPVVFCASGVHCLCQRRSSFLCSPAILF